MSVGDLIEIEAMDETGAWVDHLSLHAVKVNKSRSVESAAAGGEQVADTVEFTVRWNRFLPDVEADKPRYRIRWRGRTFDVRGYDDFMYRHRQVKLTGVSYG